MAETNAARADTVGGGVISAGVDVRDLDSMRGMIDAVVDRFVRLDVKFNNAGDNKPMSVLDVTDEYLISSWSLKWAVLSLKQPAVRNLARHDITVTDFPAVEATEMWEEVDRDLMAIGASERPGQAMEEFTEAS